LVVGERPISAGHDWPLYGDEYGRMKFGNVPKRDHHNFQLYGRSILESCHSARILIEKFVSKQAEEFINEI